jgi:hypothetical protein
MLKKSNAYIEMMLRFILIELSHVAVDDYDNNTKWVTLEQVDNIIQSILNEMK